MALNAVQPRGGKRGAGEDEQAGRVSPCTRAVHALGGTTREESRGRRPGRGQGGVVWCSLQVALGAGPRLGGTSRTAGVGAAAQWPLWRRKEARDGREESARVVNTTRECRARPLHPHLQGTVCRISSKLWFGATGLSYQHQNGSFSH